MDQIDIKAVESFFATVGSHIYEVAEKTVKEFSIDEYIHSGVLVGLSGGADSVLLLCFLLEYRRRNHLDFTICASHINHGIRGDEADSDEEFCRRLCESLGVELLVDKYSIPQIAERFKMSIEEAARWRRYASFDRIIHGRSDVRCVAVAHNMEHLFMCFMAICISSLEKYLFTSSAWFFIAVVVIVFFQLRFMSPLYILKISPWSSCFICKYFLPF